jgi:energy-coupling factor transporter ATP-binding protein EcfA2
MTSIIRFDQLSFTYNRTEKAALKNISAEINKGAFVVLMGAGGSGKSSLCYTPNGIIPHLLRGHYSGRAFVKEQEVRKQKVWELARHVGLVLQDFDAQLFSSSVELEMAFGLENLGIPRDEIGTRIAKYLALIGMDHKRQFEPASLSGGQKQRLAIAAIMCMEPEILVMDEPTTDLDPVARREILALAAHSRDRGDTLLIADHRSEIAANADEIWLMSHGELVKRGRPAEILPDIELLKDARVMPPPIIELMVRLGYPRKLWTVAESVEALGTQPGVSFDRPDSSSSQAPIIQVNELTHIYEYMAVPGLRNVSLSISHGEFVAIMGVNGSGKTTLAKHFNGLLKPTSGAILLAGKPIETYSRKQVASLIGYVFQNPDQQIFAATVLDEVSFSLRQLGYDKQAIMDGAREVLAVVGLDGLEQEDPARLTKGQRQRLAVASALITKPPVLVLDEPTKGLDYIHKKELMRLLVDLNRAGHTIVVITHSLWIVAEYAQRVVVLNSGEKVEDGPTRAVFANEEKLKSVGMGVPALAQLGNRLGLQAITMNGMEEELKGREFCRVP